MNAIAELFSDKEACFSEIRNIRDTIGTAGVTQAAFDAANKSLGFMYLHCPQEISHIVLAQMNELTRRETMLILAGKL